MESTILTNMNKLRIISIICSIISISLLFGLTSIMETEESYTEESRAAEGIERNSTLLPISLIFLFVGPAAISGVIASFFKDCQITNHCLVCIYPCYMVWNYGFSFFPAN